MQEAQVPYLFIYLFLKKLLFLSIVIENYIKTNKQKTPIVSLLCLSKGSNGLKSIELYTAACNLLLKAEK